MNNGNYYLRQNIQVEPLINRWYAWVQLLPPATAAFQIVERHLKTMESYVHSPGMHMAAVRNPAMRGGPFLDLGGKHVEQVRQLLESTRIKAALQIEFTQAVRDLDRLLQSKAQGSSMEALYRESPQLLQGYIELFYDRHHRPDFRFFEPLLYRSPLYNEAFQSIALSKICEDTSRPFVFSTPRLDDEDMVRLPIPFSSPGLDALFRAKDEPLSLACIRDQLGCEVPAEKEKLFESFFTTEPPPRYAGYLGDKMRIRYFGHACILIETRNCSILLDPVLSYSYEADVPRFTYLDLPDMIDYVLITHSHHDHLLLETLLQIRPRARDIVVARNISGALQDPSLALMLRHLGFSQVRELREFDTIDLPGGEIMALPFLGEHHDLLVDSKVCYRIRFGNRAVLAVADCCNIDPVLFERVFKQVGPADILFLGMECDGAPVSWVYGPLFTEKPEREKDRSRRGRGCNCREGMDLVRRFGCKEVYVYAMGAEPWIRYILDVHYTDESNPIVQSNMLIEECRKEGRVAERLFGEKEIG